MGHQKVIQHSKPTIGSEEIQAVAGVLRSGHLSQGAKVSRFENALSSRIGVKGAVAVNTGSAALHLVLLSLGIKARDEVVLPSYVCQSLLNAVFYVGATPVVVDIEESGYNLSVEEVKRKLTSHTKVIIVPHMFGEVANMVALLALGIPIIEDCALSLGATYKGKEAGSFGVAAVFSFYTTKVIATGEGGMVASNDKRLLEKTRDLREYNGKQDCNLRYNYKMTDLTGVMGLVQLSKLDSFIKKRRAIAAFYSHSFKDLGIRLPFSRGDNGHIYYRYMIEINSSKRDFMRKMAKEGVACGCGVLFPLHRGMKLEKKGFPNTERAIRYAVSIPIYPTLTKLELDKVVNAVKKSL